MAIGYMRCVTINRRQGRSAVGSAAYQQGLRLKDERTGNVHDYSRKPDVLHRAMFQPVCSPFKTVSQAVNAMEAAELRKDSRVCRDIVAAQPHELPLAAQIDLSEKYGAWLADRFQLVVILGLHVEPLDPMLERLPTDMRGRNPHPHFLLSTREVTSDGFGAKCRRWDNPKHSGPIMKECRQKFEEMANALLEEHGFDKRADLRRISLRDEGMEPLWHEGAAVRAMEARGIRTRVREHNRGVLERNATRRRIRVLEAERDAEIDQVIADGMSAVEPADVIRASVARMASRGGLRHRGIGHPAMRNRPLSDHGHEAALPGVKNIGNMPDAWRDAAQKMSAQIREVNGLGAAWKGATLTAPATAPPESEQPRERGST
jgi:hypothetical protein